MTYSVLATVRGYFERGLNSPAYQKWLKEAKHAWAFYDGDQWTNEEIDKLSETGQPPIVINKVAAKVDNIAGTEILGRTRITYRSRSGDTVEDNHARALTDLALYVAEYNDQALELSALFKAGLVTGLGWLDVGVEEEGQTPTIFNRYEDELQVVWDDMARRPDFADAQYVARYRWLSLNDMQQFFPHKWESVTTLKSGAVGKIWQNNTQLDTAYYDEKRDMYRVVEVQYKQTEKLYTVETAGGKTFTTFNKKQAFAQLGNTVTSSFAQRVYVAYFIDSILLSHNPLGYNHNTFTLIPYVYKRHRADGRPYGLVKAALDPQKELNKRRAKAMHLLNTAQVIADIDAVEDPNQLAKEAARPDGLILKRPGKELRILRNGDMAQTQVAVMDQASRDIQEAMGVFDETLGKQSNATSGIAIRQRQQAGTLNQMFAFDALRLSKKRLGSMLLSLIKQYFTAEMVFKITDEFGATRLIELNRSVENEKGEHIIINDVTTANFDIVVEEVPDALSSREHDLQQLELLRNAGVPIPNEMLVEATSLKNKDKLLETFTALQKTEEAPQA